MAAFIDPDASLIVIRSTHFAKWYECGCYYYFGDLDTPGEWPCDEHAIEEEEV